MNVRTPVPLQQALVRRQQLPLPTPPDGWTAMPRQQFDTIVEMATSWHVALSHIHEATSTDPASYPDGVARNAEVHTVAHEALYPEPVDPPDGS